MTTALQRYFGDWATDYQKQPVDGYRQLLSDFGIDETAVADAEILLAAYTYEDYSGSAFVLFERDGKLYEVNGGHCSCYGLEGQWTPEETTWAALKMRHLKGEVYTPEGAAELTALIASHDA